MRKLLVLTALACLGACTTPATSQPPADAAYYPPPGCRTVTGTAEIDGTQQVISGLACLQSDGTWQIVQGNDGTQVYPMAWTDATTWYAGPWYGWWPPVFVGGSFVFVDHFHHFHHMDHIFPGGPHMHPAPGMHGGFHGGFHSGHGGVWSGTGGMHGGSHR